MNLPKKFRVAGRTIKVTMVDLLNNGDDYGSFSEIHREIKIARRIKEDNVIYNIQEEEILNTFWHEVFHSFQYYWNNKCDEDFAQVLSNFMCELEQTKEY